jgi:hypothetical protein
MFPVSLPDFERQERTDDGRLSVDRVKARICLSHILCRPCESGLAFKIREMLNTLLLSRCRSSEFIHGTLVSSPFHARHSCVLTFPCTALLCPHLSMNGTLLSSTVLARHSCILTCPCTALLCPHLSLHGTLVSSTDNARHSCVLNCPCTALLCPQLFCMAGW